MPSLRAHVYRIPADGPDDVAGVEALFAGGLAVKNVVAVLGKTEGNGCVNDFSRGYATRSFEDLFHRHGVDGVSTVMSGGTEGALSPHWTIFTRETVEAPGERALAIGASRTPVLPTYHLGRRQQVLLVADGVRAAMRDAGIDDPADVHFVQIKCPLLTSRRISEAEAAGATVATRDTLKSMGLSRGASALGVAVALGEVDEAEIADADIGIRFDLFSNCASTSAGVELIDHEIIVLGMSSQWSGPFAIDHAVMENAIDARSVRRARERLPENSRLAAVLAKAEPDPSGKIGGKRHTMLDDSDISGTRHARAFVGGVLAGVFGITDLYVSGGAEHQGPPGGGPVAIIVEKET
ncbi:MULTISPECIES: ring-opening amidohydrolase [unclassified Neorhizobium]|uniref:cyanuric acid amidohydrolase n=1 Tax=unclassified Neorhizobium TaxID=2629175 RepID=UPI001FF37CA4|nr:MULTISPECIES: ring-opening amidohydrolase [unclassified Neorhizobium]MCJ9673801.1 ring-opening amidohydrolase [Neorhizobium sp. SHOUNA12B]MCJ9747502.1 ring-opening amidohydrolase [Neorhizobium sp. SHOUNA12A]